MSVRAVWGYLHGHVSDDAVDAMRLSRGCRVPEGASGPRRAMIGRASERALEVAKEDRNFLGRR